jgi:signal transduction histidine kinase
MPGQNNSEGIEIAGFERFLKHGLVLISRHTSSLLLFMVFCVVVAVGIFMMGDLHTATDQVQHMYAGSVKGLRGIGELQYEAQETRRATLYALTTNNSNLQVEYADQSRAADRLVTDGIARYVSDARTPREVELGQRLQQNWADYLKVRDEVLASILEGSTKEAVDLDLHGGVPSFERVRQDLEEVKRHYDAQASEQMALVDKSSKRSVVPLAVICASAQNIADGVVDEKEQMAKYGSVIRHHSRQLTELINQILLFAATHEGRNRYVMRPLKVSEIVSAVLMNTRVLVEEAGFVVEEHLGEDLQPVTGDFTAVCQCLQNLVVNAVKYGGDHRKIVIRAFQSLREDVNRYEMRISVEDHGIGIDTAELQQIFEPFYRSPVVTAAQIHGTGLGLALAKNIAEAMGGSISVVSRVGVGSRFTIHLPLASSVGVETTTVQRVAQL